MELNLTGTKVLISSSDLVFFIVLKILQSRAINDFASPYRKKLISCDGRIGYERKFILQVLAVDQSC